MVVINSSCHNYQLELFIDQLTISVLPSSSEVRETETAQFNARADGINKINFMYQWRKRGSEFLLPNKLPSVNETVFTIPDLSISDQGNYYCTVTNEWDRSSESEDVTLIVKGESVRLVSTEITFKLYSYISMHSNMASYLLKGRQKLEILIWWE